MIMTDHFLKGLLIGLSVAMAVGPIALLCIQRTVSYGFKTGLSTGLGAAFADALYGLIAGAGLVVISDFLIAYEALISGLGSLFLLHLGISTLRSTPKDLLMTDPSTVSPSVSTVSLFRSFGSSFLLTLSSPMTILLFTAIFAGSGIVSKSFEYKLAFSLVSGVLIGSTVWWILLSGTVTSIRSKFSRKTIKYINRVSGVLLLGFACYAITKTFVAYV